MYRAPYEDELDDDLDTSSSRAELSTELEDILAISDSSLHHVEDATEMFNIPPRQPVYFNAPFFAAWFFTNFSLLFFPIYILGLVSARKCDKLSEILADVLRGFRERGFTIGMRESIPPAPAESTLSCSSRRSLSQSMPFVLHPVAGNHLPVYAFATRALCHRCTSSFCHQCCLRLFAILGHSSRAICRREGEMLLLAATISRHSFTVDPITDCGRHPLRYWHRAPRLHGRHHGKPYLGRRRAGHFSCCRLCRVQGKLPPPPRVLCLFCSCCC